MVSIHVSSYWRFTMFQPGCLNLFTTTFSYSIRKPQQVWIHRIALSFCMILIENFSDRVHQLKKCLQAIIQTNRYFSCAKKPSTMLPAIFSYMKTDNSNCPLQEDLFCPYCPHWMSKIKVNESLICVLNWSIWHFWKLISFGKKFLLYNLRASASSNRLCVIIDRSSVLFSVIGRYGNWVTVITYTFWTVAEKRFLVQKLRDMLSISTAERSSRYDLGKRVSELLLFRGTILVSSFLVTVTSFN